MVEIHDLHVWEVTSGFPSLSAHVLVPPKTDCHAKRAELEEMLAQRFGVEHTTPEVDRVRGDELLAIAPPIGLEALLKTGFDGVLERCQLERTLQARSDTPVLVDDKEPRFRGKTKTRTRLAQTLARPLST